MISLDHFWYIFTNWNRYPSPCPMLNSSYDFLFIPRRLLLTVALYVKYRKEKTDVADTNRTEFVLVSTKDEIRLSATLSHLKQI